MVRSPESSKDFRQRLADLLDQRYGGCAGILICW